MKTLEPVLSEHPFLKGLEAHHLQLIVGCASNVVFQEGQFVFRANEEAKQFYVIRHGKVAVDIFSPERGPVTIQTLGEGEILGWSWLIPPYHWHFDARAIELTRAIVLDGACLRQKCEQDHDLGYELLKRFAHIMEQRLQAMSMQLLDVYGNHS